MTWSAIGHLTLGLAFLWFIATEIVHVCGRRR